MGIVRASCDRMSVRILINHTRITKDAPACAPQSPPHTSIHSSDRTHIYKMTTKLEIFFTRTCTHTPTTAAAVAKRNKTRKFPNSVYMESLEIIIITINSSMCFTMNG